MTFELKTKSTARELFELTQRVIGAAAEHGASDRALHNLRLVLEELLTNIRLHAYPHAPGPVELEADFSHSPAGIEVTLRDYGPAFDPLTQSPPPRLESCLEERPLGGLGVHFVRVFTQGLAYRRLLPELSAARGSSSVRGAGASQGLEGANEIRFRLRLDEESHRHPDETLKKG